ncbi:hypothetical protein [Ruminiclostridium cellulolyticum]|uniref:Uncharacterized protein n=1 Tax=Ruminiclostridium cellulolyticum (strain ATCC 35319 / DSM 5812 / JCM 6584 / H10) TaxID=394503 RepID=B8I6N2_RUMCH|nr:hypothetical protein [Ruminiclostridium cellulolyticum]ACL74924.1 hypothetical protein Ccel_0542 [Ruminiclostridium cellulolyticum H10]
MSTFRKKHKENDIEHPMSSTLLGRDILGINPNNPALNKTTIDLQDEKLSTDYTCRVK